MKYYTLAEICSIEYGKDHKRLDDGDIPLFGTSGVIRYVNASLYSGPSVMIPRKGTLSGVYFSDKPFWTIDTLFYTKVNEDIVLAKYLYYYLKTLDFNNLDEGTTVPSLTRATLYQLKIPVPSLKEQEYIVSVLESIDCQIELNQAINDNLTALISTMYDSCITKSISHGTAQKLTFNCFANITSGKRPNSFSKTESLVFSIPVYGASSLLGFCDSWIYNEPILIIGRVGSLGVVTRSKKFSWPSDNTLVISTQFYEFTCETLRRIDYKKISGGSSQPLITQKNLCQYPVIVPSEHELLDFEEKSYPYMALYDENNEQNEYLRKIRDYLANNLFSANIELRK